MITEDNPTAIKTKCPKCQNPISIEAQIKIQDAITCPKCKTMLEVISKVPLTLSRVKNVAEYDSRQLLRR